MSYKATKRGFCSFMFVLSRIRFCVCFSVFQEHVLFSNLSTSAIDCLQRLVYDIHVCLFTTQAEKINQKQKKEPTDRDRQITQYTKNSSHYYPIN